METQKDKARDDFDPKVINTAKTQAAYICSNPSCRKLTIAPSLIDENKVQYMGKVAHITAAAVGGPRYDKDISEEERKSIRNAIFLCSNCADLIDKNKGIDYPESLLYDWRAKHREWVIANLNKSQSDGVSVAVTSYSQSGGINAQVVNIHQTNDHPQDSAKQHDVDNFRRSENILNNEQWSNLRNDLLGDASCKIRESERLEDIFKYFSKAENKFVDQEIDQARNDFIKLIPPLTEMLHLDFDQWPYNQNADNFNIQLRPDYLRDTQYKKHTWEQRQEWDVLFKKMTGYIESIDLAYNIYRTSIKLKLYI